MSNGSQNPPTPEQATLTDAWNIMRTQWNSASPARAQQLQTLITALRSTGQTVTLL